MHEKFGLSDSSALLCSFDSRIVLQLAELMGADSDSGTVRQHSKTQLVAVNL
jgi:hypothetical protein